MPQNFNEYLEILNPKQQKIMLELNNQIKKWVPEAEEAMSYGVPAFKYKKKSLIIYAVFKEHLGVYPEPEAIEFFKEELKQYETSKGTIKFKLSQPIPFALIKKIVNYKLKKNLSV